MDFHLELAGQLKDVELVENFSFRRHTTIGCGGTASLCARPKSLSAALTLLKFLEEEQIPHLFLGAGANVLCAEGHFNGVVVKFSSLCGIRYSGGEIFAGAGATGGALCRFARENGIGGFEPFTGIPMTVGGGIVMNAGVSGGHVSNVIKKVAACIRGKLTLLSNAECGFFEKQSVFQSGIAVLGAVFSAEKKDKALIERDTRLYAQKRAHLPKGRSMGCCFVNPQKDVSAGKLIESCGLKGYSSGGAYVSSAHANFILNENGDAEDVARLLDFIKCTVSARTGIELKEEIRRLAFDT